RSSHPDQMGRVEIGLLDENSDYVARISMNDVHWQAEHVIRKLTDAYLNLCHFVHIHIVFIFPYDKAL
ncbi:hypothetical protein ACUOA8_58105, partial [Escherichia sp. SS-MK2]